MSGKDIGLVIILFIIRLFLLFGDRAFGSQWEKYSSLAQQDREVAEDVHDALNARSLVVTWPLLLFVGVIFRLPSLCGRADVFLIIVSVVAGMLVAFAFSCIPFRYFQGKLSSTVALSGMTVLDITAGLLVQDEFLKNQFC